MKILDLMCREQTTHQGEQLEFFHVNVERDTDCCF